MNDMDWQILTVLHERRSITKTAEVLYITQSALTKRLRSIEKEWNIEIVKRNSKGVIFIEEGRYLVKRAHIIMDFIKETRDYLSIGGELKESIKIGVPNSFSRLHFPKLMKEYINNYDKLQFRIIPNSSDIIIKQIMDGSIDIGIICGDYPYNGEKFLMFKEDLYIAAPHNMNIDDLENMTIIESYLNPMVKNTVKQWWRQRFGHVFHESHKVPYAEIAIEMVENGLGICFLFGDDWSINKEKSQIIPVCNNDGHPISRNVWMMISERCFKSDSINDFIRFSKEYYGVNERYSY